MTSNDSPLEPVWPGFERRAATPIRIVLVDDHPIVREGLSALLSLEGDLEIVGDAGTVEKAIELVRDLNPDLVLCDLTMPGCSRGIAVRNLCREFPNTRVLVLTAHNSLEIIREAFAAGATGYVLKDALRADLLAAVRRAAAGRNVTCPVVGDMVVRNWLQEDRAPEDPLREPLDAEDRKLLRLIALGIPNWRIAEEMGRGVKALEKYRATLMRRLDLNSTAAVARFAVRCNLLSNQEVDKLVSA